MIPPRHESGYKSTPRLLITYSAFLNIFEEKIQQTQIAVAEAMAELGWLDDATAENGAGATEHTTS